ncbi:MAG: hypothetical protein ACKOQ7_03765 [Actinomycetota bacterium]
MAHTAAPARLRRTLGAFLIVLGTVGCSNIDDEARNAALLPQTGATLSMRFLRTATISPVSGLKVTVIEMATDKRFEAVSDSRGLVLITGLVSDEYRVDVNGIPVGYASGSVGCQTPKKVVKWSYACTHMPRALGDVYISRL